MVATTGSDADLGYPVISDVGGTGANKEGGQMPSYADCQNQTNPLWLSCPSALIRLANGAIIELPPWERSLLDGLAGLDSGGDAAFAKGDGETPPREVVDPKVYESLEQARNAALKELGEIDEATRVPYKGTRGPGKGMIVGFQTRVNGVWKRLRIDFDESKKAHIHVESKGVNKVFRWSGTLSDFLSQLEVLQRDPAQ